LCFEESLPDRGSSAPPRRVVVPLGDVIPVVPKAQYRKLGIFQKAKN
jgi:hypothetical protein